MSINFILNIGVLGCVCVLGAVTGGHLFLNVEIFSVVSQLKWEHKSSKYDDNYINITLFTMI